jgi:predicted Zn finger-like uncharacterized protein
MLLTTCPNCAAQFKIQPEQLNVRQGRVMCGRCRQVFDAFQSLTRIEDSAAAPQEPSGGLIAASAEQMPAITLKVATDYQRPFDNGSSTPQFVDDATAVPAPPAADDAQAQAQLSSAEPGPEDSPLVKILPLAVPRQIVEPVSAVPGLLLDADNQLPRTPPPQYRPASQSISPWALCAFLLALVFVAQLTYALRAQLGQQFPAVRPLLVGVCDWAGCVVPHGRDEAAIRIEASDLVEAPGRTGRILLSATLANRSFYNQEYPAMELRLTDSGNQVVLSRVFQPGEYLGRGLLKEEAIAPGAEVFINMQVELQGKPPASGYGVRAFYP